MNAEEPVTVYSARGMNGDKLSGLFTKHFVGISHTLESARKKSTL